MILVVECMLGGLHIFGECTTRSGHIAVSDQSWETVATNRCTWSDSYLANRRFGLIVAEFAAKKCCDYPERSVVKSQPRRARKKTALCGGGSDV